MPFYGPDVDFVPYIPHGGDQAWIFERVAKRTNLRVAVQLQHFGSENRVPMATPFSYTATGSFELGPRLPLDTL